MPVMPVNGCSPLYPWAVLKFEFFSMFFAEPNERLTLAAVAEHTWVIGEDGPVPQYLCWCKRKNLPKEESDGSNDDTLHNPN